VLNQRLFSCMIIIIDWCEIASARPDQLQDFTIIRALQIRFDVDTVLALKSGYYLNSEKATLISAADDIRILAYVKARGG
jgi:hypothetical protein